MSIQSKNHSSSHSTHFTGPRQITTGKFSQTGLHRHGFGQLVNELLDKSLPRPGRGTLPLDNPHIRKTSSLPRFASQHQLLRHGAGEAHHNRYITSPKSYQNQHDMTGKRPFAQVPTYPYYPHDPKLADLPTHSFQPKLRGRPTLPTNPLNTAESSTIRLAPHGEGAKTGELSGQDRPNPREISNAVAAQDNTNTSNANNASDILWSWGQFIDHDVVQTAEGEERANIRVPKGDPNFDPSGTGGAFIPFKRSEGSPDANGNREQLNTQTPLLDASMVYGATDEKTASLRSFEGGKMKIDETGHLLPDEKDVVLAGDSRAAEQPGLLSLHTLFVREHNRQADLIAQENPTWSDQQIFTEAKRRNTNQIQAITYNEFLPTLLGDQAPDPTRLAPGGRRGKAIGTAYRTDPRISSEFSTAGYRLGHTLVNETIATKNADGTLSQSGLDESFFKPQFTRDNGIGSILSGQSDQKAQKVDPMIVNALRNRLLTAPDQAGPRVDLASLNIQRGRDHNLPTYNDMRESMGLRRIDSFNDPVFQNGAGAKLAEVYGSPDQIDLWVGGLSEKAHGTSMLGQTFTGIVGEQFARTAAADPNFYTRNASPQELAYLDQLSLADIVRANSSNAQIDDTPFVVD